jgi:ABC-type glycerol-3-phosphate transport system permease component
MLIMNLGKYTYKSFFRVLALLLLCCIPLHWIVVRDLNQQSEIISIIHIFLSIFILYLILNRPTPLADQLLRWAIIFYLLGDLIFTAFVNEITWVAYIQDVLITISFLIAYFTSKKRAVQTKEL